MALLRKTIWSAANNTRTKNSVDAMMTLPYYPPSMHIHARNIERYRKLLATQLTEVERDYMKRRISEERAALLELKRKHSENYSSAPPSSGSPTLYVT